VLVSGEVPTRKNCFRNLDSVEFREKLLPLLFSVEFWSPGTQMKGSWGHLFLIPAAELFGAVPFFRVACPDIRGSFPVAPVRSGSVARLPSAEKPIP